MLEYHLRCFDGKKALLGPDIGQDLKQSPNVNDNDGRHHHHRDPEPDGKVEDRLLAPEFLWIGLL